MADPHTSQRSASESDTNSESHGRTITRLLQRWSQGQREAAEQLMPLVYEELRRMAHRYFRRERQDHTLQATALVHEVYLKLLDQTGVELRDRSHFYGLAACMMRRALVDYSRERAVAKRGGDLIKVPLKEAGERASEQSRAIVALDDALNGLGRLDPQKALIVELRFFGGLTVDQTADCIGLSPRSVAREWRQARAVLYRELAPEARDAL